jgi:hypothetical protein
MHSFLQNTAAAILSSYADLQQVVIVLPNRRAGLFFTKHMGALIQQPTWMPEVISIEDLFYNYAGQRPADDLSLIFTLYNVYQKLHPNPEGFDQFYHWGEMILKDFNSLDQFMVDAKKLYLYLHDLKSFDNDTSYLTTEQIELIRQFWSSFKQQDLKHQEKFLKFWQILNPLYHAYQEELDKQQLAYSGKLYRRVVTNILHQIPKSEKRYVFVGFNAFTSCEERLIKYFIQELGAEIRWDIDAYYLNDKNQEAGLFFRDYKKDPVFGPTFPVDIPELISGKKAKIHTYAIPLKVNQANLVGKLLEDVKGQEDWEDTVIILPDEQMLFPVLHSLPPAIDKVNVTMGYPVKNAPIYTFLEAVLELQRYVRIEEGKVLFYHKAVKDLLSSGFLKNSNPEFVKEIFNQIQSKNKIYLPDTVLQQGGEFFKLLFRKVYPEHLFTYMSDLMQALASMLQDEPLQRSYLFQCFKQLNRLREVFELHGNIKVDLEFFIRLFRQVFRETKLPFEGEPLKGLQIMGVLETRNLDFKRVIICNMNEDAFPPTATLSSMIPFNIRRAFNLPVQEQNDAIYAYTFYRLLQCAEEVHMIYTTGSEQGKAGEKSRYIQQLMVELDQEIQEEVIFVPVDYQRPKPILIQKTNEVMELLMKFVGEVDHKLPGLSPSALNVYLDCRLKFYFQNLAKIKEKEEVNEEVDAAVFGNLAHYSMEFLYAGFIERKGRDILEKHDFQELGKNWIVPSIELGIRKFYQLEKDADTKLNGQLAIVRDVLQRYIQRLLELDASNAPFQLLGMEKAFYASREIQVGQNIKKVRVKGFIDRIDFCDNNIRLIDYKSGKDEKNFKDIASLFDRDDVKRNKAAMQTLYYGMLFQANYPHNPFPLKPAIFNFKEIFQENFNPYLQDKSAKTEVMDYRDYQEAYEAGLKTLLEELFDREVPFDQTQNISKCQHCPYAGICGR